MKERMVHLNVETSIWKRVQLERSHPRMSASETLGLIFQELDGFREQRLKDEFQKKVDERLSEMDRTFRLECDEGDKE